MKEPVWLLKQAVLACHAAAVLEHGGSAGVRDEGLLDSALARPLHLLAFERADLCALAAAYAFGIAKNHPFVDGNKRTAFLAAAVFLARNDLQLRAQPGHAAVFMLGLADGTLAEAGFAQWLRDNTRSHSRGRSKKRGAGRSAQGRRASKRRRE